MAFRRGVDAVAYDDWRSGDRRVEIRFPEHFPGIGIERIDNAVMAIEYNCVACEYRRISPLGLRSVKIAGEMPAKLPGGNVKTEKVITLRDGINGFIVSHKACGYAAVKVGGSRNEVFPADFASGAVKGVDVALFANICANDYQVGRDERIAVKAGLAAILMDVVAPADLAGVFVESIEVSRARADVKRVSRNCGRGKDSTSGVELPPDGRVRRLLRLRRRVIGLSEASDGSKAHRGDYERCSTSKGK